MSRLIRFTVAKEKAEQESARASEEAAALAREEAALERQKEMTAATTLQAWARGVEARNAVTAALEARGLPLLAAERRRQVRVKDSFWGWPVGLRPVFCSWGAKEGVRALLTTRHSREMCRLS